jgi:hypothetical protein
MCPLTGTSSMYVINRFCYNIPLVILYIRSETSNWKLDLKPRLHTRNQDSRQKNGAQATTHTLVK